MPTRRTRHYPRLPLPIGQRFGLWLVLGAADDGPRGNRRVRVKCGGCGLERALYLQSIEEGRSKSCLPCAMKARRGETP